MPAVPSSHSSPIVRRGFAATWSFRRLPSKSPVDPPANSNTMYPASSPAITGFIFRSRAYTAATSPIRKRKVSIQWIAVS